jgi:drug/metabolite transporter (DMT)-like permease
VAAVFGPRHGRRLFATQAPGAQLAQSVLLVGSTALNFAAIRYVDLATVTTINFTSPLLVALLAAPLLGERVGARRWAAILVGFAGVLVVLQPGAGAARAAALLSLGTAACYALYQILARRLAATDAPETTIGYSALVGTIVTSVVVPLAWETPRSPLVVVLFASMGLTGGLGHYFVARAYVWAPASVVSPFNYVQLLGAAAAGYLVFGEVPGAGLWLGAALVVASGLAVVYGEQRARPASAPPTAERATGGR